LSDASTHCDIFQKIHVVDDLAEVVVVRAPDVDFLTGKAVVPQYLPLCGTVVLFCLPASWRVIWYRVLRSFCWAAVSAFAVRWSIIVLLSVLQLFFTAF